MTQHETMPDTPEKSIQTARSLSHRNWKLEFPPQPKMHPDSTDTTREESQSVSGYEKGGLTFLRNHQRFTTIHVVTRVEPRVSYANLRKPTKFHLQCKMMLNSPAWSPEQFRAPHKHERRLDFLYGNSESPQEHCHNSRETPKSLLQLERALCNPNHLKMRAHSFYSLRE